MRRIYLVVLVIGMMMLLTVIKVRAQLPSAPDLSILNPTERSTVWVDYSKACYTYVVKKNQFDNFEHLIAISKKGISLTSDKDYSKLSIYHFILGHTYKVQLKYDSAFYHLKKAIAYGSEQNTGFEVKAIQQVLYLNRFLGRAEETKPYVQRLNKLLPLCKDEEVKDNVLSALSEDYLANGNYTQAISLLLQSLPLKEKIFAEKKDFPSKINIGLAYFSLGNLYLELQQNNNALQHYKAAEPYLNEYPGGKVRLYIKLQQTYLNLNHLDSAKHFYHKVYAANSDKKIFFESSTLSSVNANLANYFLAKKNVAEAKKYSDLAYQLALKSESPESILYAQNLMGSLNFYQQNYLLAIQFLKQALPNSSSFSKDIYAGIVLKLAESYEKIGNYQESLLFYKKYNLLFQEIYKEKSNEEISKVEFKYKSIQKQKQIDELSEQTVIANRLLKQQNQLQAALLIAIALILTIAFLIYINYRNKNKSNKLLQKVNADLDTVNTRLFAANQSKARLFSIISHDLRKPIGQLFNILKIQQGKSSLITEADRDKYQHNLLNASVNLLDTLEDLLTWSKSQLENFKVENEEVEVEDMIRSVVDLMQTQAEAKNITFVIDEFKFKIIHTDFNLLQTILRNIVQNAVNYSFSNTSIFIRTAIGSGGYPKLVVSNQGEVIPAHKIEQLMANNALGSSSSGYGLMLIKDLSERINAKLHIESDEFNGTTTEIHFLNNKIN